MLLQNITICHAISVCSGASPSLKAWFVVLQDCENLLHDYKCVIVHWNIIPGISLSSNNLQIKYMNNRMCSDIFKVLPLSINMQ